MIKNLTEFLILEALKDDLSEMNNSEAKEIADNIRRELNGTCSLSDFEREVKKLIPKIKKEYIHLEPCPFCGGKATIVNKDNGDKTSAKCEICGCNTGYYQSQSNGIEVERWNRRVEKNIFTVTELQKLQESLQEDTYLFKKIDKLLFKQAQKEDDQSCDESKECILCGSKIDTTLFCTNCELKQYCPSCFKNDIFVVSSEFGTFMGCDDCGLETIFYKNKADLIHQWNTGMEK